MQEVDGGRKEILGIYNENLSTLSLPLTPSSDEQTIPNLSHELISQLHKTHVNRNIRLIHSLLEMIQPWIEVVALQKVEVQSKEKD